MKKLKSVVIIGGGHGGSVIIDSLKDYRLQLTAAISMADDGGSTGRLRRELGVSAPGDIRQALVALAKDESLKDLFSYRFSKGNLKGHSFGNIFLTAGELMFGDFQSSVELAKKTLEIKSDILPITDQKVNLVLLQNGVLTRGEYNIGNTTINPSHPDLKYDKPAIINKAVQQKIASADLVVIAPGNFYCSIIPPLMVEGVAKALKDTEAKIIMICNLVNLPKHTRGFRADDYVDEVERFIGKNIIDSVIYNTATIDKKFFREGEDQVGFDASKLKAKSYNALGIDLADSRVVSQDANDEIAAIRSLIEHNKKALGVAITKQIKLIT